MKIDVHAHYIPEAFIEPTGPETYRVSVTAQDGRSQLHSHALPNLSLTGVKERISGIDRRLADMHNQGIDMHILSVAPGCFYYGLETPLAIKLCRRFNDVFAETVSHHPEHFVALATLPMQSPKDAALELERAVRDLGLRGAEIASNINGQNLDEKGLAPFFAKVQELNVPLFIHPNNPGGMDRLGRYGLQNLIGLPTDTGVAAASLIFGGVLTEFPHLRVCLAHGGGSCLALWGRWQHGWQSLQSRGSGDQTFDVNIAEPPSKFIQLLYFDSLIHDPATLEFLIASVGANRVMLGTDYPFPMGDYRSVEKIAALSNVGDGGKELLWGATAAELFKV